MLVLFFTILIRINGQEVAASAGDYFETSTGSISWTLGEVSIETLNSDNITLTQGFQQTYFSDEQTVIATNFNAEILVYPIPANEILTIEFRDFQNKAKLILYNIMGEEVVIKQMKSAKTTINLDHLPSSEYLLNIVDGKNKLIQSFKIIKN
ncbi:MAG: T9SS type A sorting domain-containing protein [Bacteroidales bacterium]|nr:T9SS type A sorting domain-containing protein [Bacteroidales bacterium]